MLVIGGKEYNYVQASVAFGMAPEHIIADRKKRGLDDISAALKPSIQRELEINDAFGQLLCFDGYDLDRKKAADVEYVNAFLASIPDSVGMQVIDPARSFYYEDEVSPKNSGVTGVVVLSTSHCSIHNFHIQDFITLDLYSCKCFDPSIVVRKIVEAFGCTDFDVAIHLRGKRYKRMMRD